MENAIMEALSKTVFNKASNGNNSKTDKSVNDVALCDEKFIRFIY